MKILVCGVGSMGWNHARVCSELGVLGGICDLDHKQSDSVAGHFSVNGFSDFENAIQSSLFDAAIIATPTTTHYEITKSALESGLHVLVEKPIVDDLHKGEELISIAKERNLTLTVGHIERHNPVIKRAKLHLDKGDWGELITMNSRRVSTFSGRITDVGAILDTGIHDIDNLIYLMGAKPTQVFASGGSFNNLDHEDHANIVINFSNGKSGVIEVNWITPMKVRNLSLTCENCFVELDYIKQQLFVSRSSVAKINTPRLFPAPIEFKSTKINLNKQEPLRLEIEDFIDSIQSGRNPLVSAEDALVSIKVAIACVESLRSGNVVNLQ